MKFSPLYIAMTAVMLSPLATQAATYQLTEIAKPDEYKQSFPAAINNANQIVMNLTDRYNYPVNLDVLDLTSAYLVQNLTAEEIEEVRKGTISARVLDVIKTYLKQSSTDYTVQRYAEVYAYRGDSQQLLKIRETATTPTNNEYLLDINDNGYMLGFATTPYSLQSFLPQATDDEPNPVPYKFWMPEPMYITAMVIKNNLKLVVKPPYTDYGGGFSYASAISKNGYIVGVGSTGMSATAIASVENTCKGLTSPVAMCYHQQAVAGIYQSAPTVWKITDQNQIEVVRTLGYLGDNYSGQPHERSGYASISYTSSAVDINDSGIAVGTSTYSDSSDIRSARGYADYVYSSNVATLFDGNELKAIVDPKAYLASSAVAINNKNIVTGYVNELILSANRAKAFVYNYETDTIEWIEDLFDSASTRPVAINENGMIVGTTEVIATGSSTRRNAGFMYDTTSKTFSDLNKLLGCNSSYNIVAANAINDNNVIVATAVKEVDQRNSKGELVLDNAGNPVKENIAVAVQLTPIANGQMDDCSAIEQPTYERKGAAVGGWLLLLLPLVGFCRRRQS